MDAPLKVGDTVYEHNPYQSCVINWTVRHITDGVVCVGGARYFNVDELGKGRWFRHYPYRYVIVGAAAFWLGRTLAVAVGLLLIAAALVGAAVLVAIGLRLGGL